jgi:hypothetical protein
VRAWRLFWKGVNLHAKAVNAIHTLADLYQQECHDWELLSAVYWITRQQVKNEIGRQRIVFMRIPVTCDYNSTRCKQVQREFNYFLSSSNRGLGTLYSHARIYFECSNPSLIERSLLILDAWRNNYFGFIVRRMMALLTTQTTSPSIFVNTLAMMKFHIAFSCLTILTRPVAESAV